MAMAKFLLLLALVAATISSCSCSTEAINALRPRLGSGRQLAQRAGVPCDSWRLAVEAYNKRDWKTVPAECENYVGHYMLGEQYRRDSRVVVDEALAYAESLELAGKGKVAWVLDIDETTLSNVPYYAAHGFGYVYCDFISLVYFFLEHAEKLCVIKKKESVSYILVFCRVQEKLLHARV